MDHIDDGARLALPLAAFLAGWWVWIRVNPWVKCGKCGGSSTQKLIKARPFGVCRRCGGAGKRLRFGAWLLGYNKTTGAKK